MFDLENWGQPAAAHHRGLNVSLPLTLEFAGHSSEMLAQFTQQYFADGA